MKRVALLVLGAAVVLTLIAPNALLNQCHTQEKVDSVVGAVTDVDTASRRLTVKTDAGAVVLIRADDHTTFLRLPVGERTLSKATPAKLAEIVSNDRVLAHGTKSDQVFLAQRLIVMPAAEVARKREQDLDEWKRRGIGGIVREVNSQSGEITLELRGSAAVMRLPLQTMNAAFHRYVAGSLRFEDARASKLEDVHVGDQLRALGGKSSDGNSFVAEQIVSGAFKTIGVTVTAVDYSTGRISAATLDQKKPVTISINKDSVLHRIPPPVAMAIAQRAKGDAGKSVGAPPLPGKVDPGKSSSLPKAGPPVIDVQQMIDSLPTVSLSDIKPGDVLAVTGAVDNDNAHLVAIKIAAGVDLVLKALAPAPGKPQSVRLSAGLPSVFDFSVIPVN
jgi:hypothetical protein